MSEYFIYIVFHIEKNVSVVYFVYVTVKFDVFITNAFNAVHFTFMLSYTNFIHIGKTN